MHSRSYRRGADSLGPDGFGASPEARPARGSLGSCIVTTIRVRVETEYEADADEVWAVLADYRHDADWREGVVRMTQSTSGPVVEGTTTVEEFRMLGTRSTNHAAIRDVVPGRSFRWATLVGVDAEGRREVEAVDGGRTRVRLELDVRPHGVERLLRPVLRSALTRAHERSLERLRALVERR